MYKYNVMVTAGGKSFAGVYICDEPTAKGAQKKFLHNKWVEFDGHSQELLVKIKTSAITSVSIWRPEKKEVEE